MDTIENRSLYDDLMMLYNLDTNEFCVNGRIIPSLFLIGIQKCGTTTLDEVLKQFPQLSHGRKKEHHFFDQENYMKNYTDYVESFPECNTGTVRSFDATPNYSNPDSYAAENIKQFYEEHGIPLNKLIFIAIVCSNSRRISSSFYRNNFFGKKLNFNITSFNKWFDWILKHQDQDIPSRSPISRGFYDEIFAKYLKLFPKSTFLLIDSHYALAKLQELGDFLANELNLPKQFIPNIHKNRGFAAKNKSSNKYHAKKENLTEFNLKHLYQFYSKHVQKFLDIVKQSDNAKTFPMNIFLAEWPERF